MNPAIGLLTCGVLTAALRFFRKKSNISPIHGEHPHASQPTTHQDAPEKEKLPAESTPPLSSHADEQSRYWPAQFERDYGYAVLHIATLRIREDKTERYILLFAMLELIPKEIPQLILTVHTKPKKLPGSKSKHERACFVSHIVMPIREGMQWYWDCMQQQCRLPVDNHIISPQIYRLSPEPPWPFMTCVDDGSFIQFMSSWHIYPRLHQLVSLSFSMDDLAIQERLTEAQVEAVSNHLHDHLHIDIKNHPALWGSVNLLAPNPIFREFEVRLKDSHSGAGDAISYKFILRADQDLEGLSILLEEERPCGQGLYIYNVTSLRGELEIPYQLGGNRLKVLHRDYGLLYAQGLAQFARSFSISQVHPVANRVFDFGGERTSVPIVADQEYSKMPVQTADAASASAPTPPLSKPKHLSAEAKLFQEKIDQEARQRASSAGQKVFYNDHQGARRDVRRRMANARHNILVVDSYFSYKELDYVLTVNRLSVAIRVLTSAKVLRQNPTRGKENEQLDPAQQDGYRLMERLSELRQQRYSNAVSIRVLEGQESPMHDRFLVVDGTVHILGNSLNAIGENFSVLLTSPDSKALTAQLQAFWDDAVPLEDWLARCQTGASS